MVGGNKIYLTAFLLLAAIHLAALFSGSGELAFWTKPLLMPALAFWFWNASKNVQHEAKQPLRYGVLLALGLSTLGDTALLYGNQELWFIIGLGCFLLAHLAYIFSLNQMVSFQNGFVSKHTWSVLPIGLYLFVFLYSVWENLGKQGMQVPVLIYAIVISTMLLMALNLRNRIGVRSSMLILLGALLFVLSDSCIGLSKFGTGLDWTSGAVMPTYLFGQFLLVSGFVHNIQGK